MIHILVEENYLQNNRFHRLFEGISSAARKKHEDVSICRRVDELPSGCRLVVLVCQSLKWSVDRVAELNAAGIHPLVFGFPYLDTMYDYSSIAPNYTKAAYLLTRHLLSARGGKVALLGYNEDSLPDRLKCTGIRYAAAGAGQEIEIYRNSGEVSACLEEFSRRCDGIVNIVCCNDNVAILLRRLYPQLLIGRNMGSCSGLKLSEFFDDPYPAFRVDHFEAGVRLASLWFLLVKEDSIPSTVMTFDMRFSLGRREMVADEISVDTYGGECAVDFYGDKNFEMMERLDGMLTMCDDTDLSILAALMRDETYACISERLYLAVNTVKYRVKKMTEAAGVSSRRELQMLLQEFGLIFE